MQFVGYVLHTLDGASVLYLKLPTDRNKYSVHENNRNKNKNVSKGKMVEHKRIKVNKDIIKRIYAERMQRECTLCKAITMPLLNADQSKTVAMATNFRQDKVYIIS